MSLTHTLFFPSKWSIIEAQCEIIMFRVGQPSHPNAPSYETTEKTHCIFLQSILPYVTVGS